jgi:hypothetical protein
VIVPVIEKSFAAVRMTFGKRAAGFTCTVAAKASAPASSAIALILATTLVRPNRFAFIDPSNLEEIVGEATAPT